MKSKLLKSIIAIPLLFGSMSAMAQGSLQHLSNASSHSVQAIGQAAIGGVKVAAGVVAVPLMLVGEIGEASGDVGGSLWDSATKPIGEPLEITDDIITSTASPEQAMKREGDE